MHPHLHLRKQEDGASHPYACTQLRAGLLGKSILRDRMTSALTGLRRKGAPYSLGLQDYKEGNPTQMNLSTNESHLGGSKEAAGGQRPSTKLYVLPQLSVLLKSLLVSVSSFCREFLPRGRKMTTKNSKLIYSQISSTRRKAVFAQPPCTHPIEGF